MSYELSPSIGQMSLTDSRISVLQWFAWHTLQLPSANISAWKPTWDSKLFLCCWFRIAQRSDVVHLNVLAAIVQLLTPEVRFYSKVSKNYSAAATHWCWADPTCLNSTSDSRCSSHLRAERSAFANRHAAFDCCDIGSHRRSSRREPVAWWTRKRPHSMLSSAVSCWTSIHSSNRYRSSWSATISENVPSYSHMECLSNCCRRFWYV